MTEPIPASPKPFSVAGYLTLTTLWAFLVPGLIINGVPLLFLGFTNLYAFGMLMVCVGLLYPCVVFLKRFSANLQSGRIPKSFTVRILPFWLPLFWGLAVCAIAFYVAPALFPKHIGNFFYGFPQYFLLFVLPAVFGDLETYVVAGNIINFLVAIAGTVYVARHVAPISLIRGLTLCTVIAFLLWGLACLSYKRFRAEILPSTWSSDVIRDERTRSHYGSDTDLSEYIPFAENNKLVKIKSPTLMIETEHPKIHGAFALYPIYAAAVEATYCNIEDIKFDYRRWDNPHVNVGTSPEAFESLLEGKSDMIFMAQPSEQQLQEAEAKGIELTITPIGYEAFVFFVSTVNPVDDLSLAQIRNIYSKKIIRWEEIGGKRERILPFQRPEGSGSQTMMLRVMGDVPMTPPQKEEFRHGMGEIVLGVADYRNYGNAIGFSFRYYVEGLFKHDGVKLLKIDGVAPTIENIQNKSYPLIGEIVIISRADNTNPNVAKLTEWFLSPQGQELVENVGYVPLEQ